MQVELDRTRCQGHGRCYVLAPDVFGSDDDGYGVPLAGFVAANAAAQARAAAMNCPEDAITITELEGESSG